MERIDAHRHLFRGDGELGIVLGDMDDQAIVRTVLLPLPEELAFMGKRLAENEEVFRAAEGCPDRLLAAFYLDPRRPNALDDLKRYADRGAIAVKMWPPIGFYPDQPDYYPIYEEIERRGLPVMIHTGFTDLPDLSAPRRAARTKYGMPLELDGLIRAFSGITWLYAHAGNPDFATAIHHAATHANVWLNVNGMSGDGGWDARVFRFWEKMRGACAPMPWDKLIWGSDNIGFDFDGYNEIFDQAGQGQLLSAFYAGNAKRVYGL